jgi:hypothetical protein
MWHEWVTRGPRVGYWWENQKEKSLGRPRHGWVNNEKDVGETGCSSVNWISLAQCSDKRRILVNAVVILRVP